MYLPTPTYEQGVIQGQFLCGLQQISDISLSLTGCLTKVKECSLPDY